MEEGERKKWKEEMKMENTGKQKEREDKMVREEGFFEMVDRIQSERLESGEEDPVMEWAMERESPLEGLRGEELFRAAAMYLNERPKFRWEYGWPEDDGKMVDRYVAEQEYTEYMRNAAEHWEAWGRDGMGRFFRQGVREVIETNKAFKPPRPRPRLREAEKMYERLRSMYFEPGICDENLGEMIIYRHRPLLTNRECISIAGGIVFMPEGDGSQLRGIQRPDEIRLTEMFGKPCVNLYYNECYEEEWEE